MGSCVLVNQSWGYGGVGKHDWSTTGGNGDGLKVCLSVMLLYEGLLETYIEKAFLHFYCLHVLDGVFCLYTQS
jgi:hypothetical protein